MTCADFKRFIMCLLEEMMEELKIRIDKKYKSTTYQIFISSFLRIASSRLKFVAFFVNPKFIEAGVLGHSGDMGKFTRMGGRNISGIWKRR